MFSSLNVLVLVILNGDTLMCEATVVLMSYRYLKVDGITQQGTGQLLSQRSYGGWRGTNQFSILLNTGLI